jgi:hypothetical protein
MPKLASQIGKAVRYHSPPSVNGPDLIGKIVDEVWADEAQRDPQMHTHDDPYCWGHYAFCSQLIKWEDPPMIAGTYSIRLAYFRLPCKGGKWKMASQTTVEYWPSTIKLLLERTLAKTDWFIGPGKAPKSD